MLENTRRPAAALFRRREPLAGFEDGRDRTAVHQPAHHDVSFPPKLLDRFVRKHAASPRLSIPNAVVSHDLPPPETVLLYTPVLVVDDERRSLRVPTVRDNADVIAAEECLPADDIAGPPLRELRRATREWKAR